MADWGNYPINLPLVPEKVSPFTNLAPVTRFWEGVVKRPSRSTAWIKTEASRLKIVNDLPRKDWGGFHIIRLRAEQFPPSFGLIEFGDRRGHRYSTSAI
jgi:hypothetical protein